MTRSSHHRQAFLRFFGRSKKSSSSSNQVVFRFQKRYRFDLWPNCIGRRTEVFRSYVEQQLPDLHHCCCLLCENPILQNSQIKAPPKKHEFGFSQQHSAPTDKQKTWDLNQYVWWDVHQTLMYLKQSLPNKINKLLPIDFRW